MNSNRGKYLFTKSKFSIFKALVFVQKRGKLAQGRVLSERSGGA